MTTKATHHTDHEGAKEAAEPGQPETRRIIKPDWVELQDEEQRPGQAPHGRRADVPGDAAEEDKT